MYVQDHVGKGKGRERKTQRKQRAARDVPGNVSHDLLSPFRHSFLYHTHAFPPPRAAGISSNGADEGTVFDDRTESRRVKVAIGRSESASGGIIGLWAAAKGRVGG